MQQIINTAKTKTNKNILNKLNTNNPNNKWIKIK